MLKCIRDGTACSQGPKSYMEDRQISVPDLALKMPYYSTESFPLTRAYFGVRRPFVNIHRALLPSLVSPATNTATFCVVLGF
jgi:hypothetical protein